MKREGERGGGRGRERERERGRNKASGRQEQSNAMMIAWTDKECVVVPPRALTCNGLSKLSTELPTEESRPSGSSRRKRPPVSSSRDMWCTSVSSSSAPPGLGEDSASVASTFARD